MKDVRAHSRFEMLVSIETGTFGLPEAPPWFFDDETVMSNVDVGIDHIDLQKTRDSSFLPNVFRLSDNPRSTDRPKISLTTKKQMTDLSHQFFDNTKITKDQSSGYVPSYTLTELRTHTFTISGEISFCGSGPAGSTCFCIDGELENGEKALCVLGGFLK